MYLISAEVWPCCLPCPCLLGGRFQLVQKLVFSRMSPKLLLHDLRRCWTLVLAPRWGSAPAAVQQLICSQTSAVRRCLCTPERRDINSWGKSEHPKGCFDLCWGTAHDWQSQCQLEASFRLLLQPPVFLERQVYRSGRNMAWIGGRCDGGLGVWSLIEDFSYSCKKLPNKLKYQIFIQ